MQTIKKQGPLTLFKEQFIFILNKIKEKFDWTTIDQHESLTFLRKNYHQKPSDIAKVLIVLLGIALLFIEGIKVFMILMCYLLPIGIMILKISEVMRNEKEKKREEKYKEKNEHEISPKSNLEKNESNISASFNVESEKQQKNSQFSQNKDIEKKEIPEEIPTMKDLNQQFIFYFLLNLILDLAEPLILLFIQTVLNLLELIFNSILVLISEGSFWPLILVPFEFIGRFIVHVITFSEINQYAIVTFVCLRIILSAFLLNMNQEKRNFCQKLLFEGKFLSIFSKKEQENIHPKTE